jgi:hypothetical protein
MSLAASPRIRNVTSSSARRVRAWIRDHRMVAETARPTFSAADKRAGQRSHPSFQPHNLGRSTSVFLST